MDFNSDYFVEDLKRSARDLDELRMKTRNKVLMIYGALILAVIITIPTGFLSFIAFILLITADYIFIRKVRAEYDMRFKEIVVEPFLHYVNEAIQYFGDRMISREDYKKSGLFRIDYTSYSGDDYGSYEDENSVVEFSELDVKKVTGSGKNRSTTIFFKGLFFKITKKESDINEEEFKVVLNREGGRFPALLMSLFVGLFGIFILLMLYFVVQPPIIVYLVVAAFDIIFAVSFIIAGVSMRKDLEGVEVLRKEKLKGFKVYSDNQQKAEYYISEYLVNVLDKFTKETKLPVSLSVVSGEIYVGIGFGKDLFEGSIFKLIKEKDFLKYKKSFELIEEIKDELM